MEAIKKSIITKNVEHFNINTQIKKTYQPKFGDVAVFEVLSIGKHKAIQGAGGTNTYIFPEDKILASFGTRYATNQFEGYMPKTYQETYQILGQGGVVGVLASMHAKFDDIGATEVKLIGYAVNESGQVINTINQANNLEKYNPFKKRDYKMYLSLGSSMDSGKTTTAAFLSRGFKKQGKKVAFIKLTGTVYAKDCSLVRDCGADTAIDFSYCGYPSTYMCKTDEILNIFEALLKRVERIGPDVVVIEIADGLMQRETKALINHKSFMNSIDDVVLSCGDSLSCGNGVSILSNVQKTPILISGLFTASPLLVKEVEDSCEIPVFTLEDFVTTSIFNQVFMDDEAELLKCL